MRERTKHHIFTGLSGGNGWEASRGGINLSAALEARMENLEPRTKWAPLLLAP